MHLYHVVFGETAMLGVASILLGRKFPSGGGRIIAYLICPTVTVLLLAGLAAYLNGY